MTNKERRGANRRKKPERKDKAKEEETRKHKDKRKHKERRESRKRGCEDKSPPAELKQAQVCKARKKHARNQQLNFHKSTIGQKPEPTWKENQARVKLTIARQCSKTPPKGHWGTKPQPTFAKTGVARPKPTTGSHM